MIATQFYRQYFTTATSGYGSAIAIVLLIAVIPVMIYNLRQFRAAGGVLMTAANSDTDVAEDPDQDPSH